MNKAHYQLLAGCILALCAVLYSQFSMNAIQKAVNIKQKTGWILTVNSFNNTSVISDSKGNVLGFITVDKYGNAKLIAQNVKKKVN